MLYMLNEDSKMGDDETPQQASMKIYILVGFLIKKKIIKKTFACT